MTRKMLAAIAIAMIAAAATEALDPDSKAHHWASRIQDRLIPERNRVAFECLLQ